MKKRQMRHNPETIEVGALSASPKKALGLCPFEYAETIQGKMEKRLNHHISFDKNKSSRIINQNPIFYNRHEDIDYSHSKLMQYYSPYLAHEGRWPASTPSAATPKDVSSSPKKNSIRYSIPIQLNGQSLRKD